VRDWSEPTFSDEKSCPAEPSNCGSFPCHRMSRNFLHSPHRKAQYLMGLTHQLITGGPHITGYNHGIDVEALEK